MSKDEMSAVFNVKIEVFRDGKLINSRERHNLIVNTGKANMVKRLVVAPTKLYQFMQLGSGVTAPTSGDSGVQTPIASTIKTCETAAMSGARTAKFIKTWGPADFSAASVAEAGLFNQHTSGAGTMLARVVYTAVPKSFADTLKITWTAKII